jgi:hypothetical protein
VAIGNSRTGITRRGMSACFPSRTRGTVRSRQDPACTGPGIPVRWGTIIAVWDIRHAFLLSTESNTSNEGWRSPCDHANIHLVNVSQGRKAIKHPHITLDRRGIMQYRNNSRCYVCVHCVSASLFASVETAAPIGLGAAWSLVLKTGFFFICL